MLFIVFVNLSSNFRDRVKKACDRVKNVCDRVKNVCDRVKNVCDRVKKACDRVKNVCDRVKNVCDRVRKACDRNPIFYLKSKTKSTVRLIDVTKHYSYSVEKRKLLNWMKKRKILSLSEERVSATVMIALKQFAFR
jgi:hypothetical protein